MATKHYYAVVLVMGTILNEHYLGTTTPSDWQMDKWESMGYIVEERDHKTPGDRNVNDGHKPIIGTEFKNGFCLWNGATSHTI